MQNIKKLTAIVLSLALALTFTPASSQAAKKKVQLNKSKVTLEVGNKVQLKVKNLKKGTKVKWSSNKKKVATVSKKGKVTARKPVQQRLWRRWERIDWFRKDLSGNISFSGLSQLYFLDCSYSQLTELDVSKNTALERLWCYDNQLTELDLTNNTFYGQFCGKYCKK